MIATSSADHVKEDASAESRARRLHKYSYICTNTATDTLCDYTPSRTQGNEAFIKKTNLIVTTSRMMIMMVMMIIISLIYQTIYYFKKKNSLGNVCIASRRGGYILSSSLFLNHDCSLINKVKLVT